MSTRITITLSDEVYQRAECFVRMANRDLETVLANAIALSIPPPTPQTKSLTLTPNCLTRTSCR